MDNNRLFALFEQYRQGTLSEVETDELMRSLEKLPDEELSAILLQSWNEQAESQQFFDPAVREKMLARIKPAEAGEARVYSIGQGRKWWWMAAAVVLFLVCGLWFLVERDRVEKPAIAVSPKVKQDVAPGREGAILTLADGRQIVLDSAGNGTLTEQGAAGVSKQGNQLVYDQRGKAAEVVYNTMSTPKGRQYSLVLSDGSKVWLNAASSIRFPTAFTGKERIVELTGEGYFEVAHNAAKPFHVKVKDMDVQVLGTHFNINSYSDEPSVKTTLLEGRVQVKKGEKRVFLNPGQQAILQAGSENIRVAYGVDLDEVVAWKNGRFLFNSTDAETIMRQAARWYNVDVVFERKTTGKISGELQRTATISQLLKIIEAAGKVNFEIKGRQVIVKPK